MLVTVPHYHRSSSTAIALRITCSKLSTGMSRLRDQFFDLPESKTALLRANHSRLLWKSFSWWNRSPDSPKTDLCELNRAQSFNIFLWLFKSIHRLNQWPLLGLRHSQNLFESTGWVATSKMLRTSDKVCIRDLTSLTCLNMAMVVWFLGLWQVFQLPQCQIPL